MNGEAQRKLLLRENYPFEDEGTLIFYPPHLILTFAHKSQGGGARELLPPMCTRLVVFV